MPSIFSKPKPFFGLLLSALLLITTSLFADPVDRIKEYYGPLVIGGFDRSLVLTQDTGEVFRVFLWKESLSSYMDLSAQGLPPYVDIPMTDWEIGVSSPIAPYDMTPIKMLVGHYVDQGRHIRSPGNSYYDKPILLSNGVSFNPRFYYQDPDLTNYNFRTNLAEDHTPLIDATARIIETGKVGPAWRLFKFFTKPDFPAYSAIVTMEGNDAFEWAKSFEMLRASPLLDPKAQIDRVFAINNPHSMLNDPTSTSQFGRQDQTDYRKKVEIFEYIIDKILSRRIDRSFPVRPNVLVYPEDNIEILKMMRDMFERKVRAVLDYDRNMNRAQPPIKLVLWNLAPKALYAPIPNALRSNPAALANHPTGLAEIMVFDSSFRYTPGQSVMTPYTSRTPDAKVLSLALDISEARANRLLDGEEDCSIVLSSPPPPKPVKGEKP